jgi:hypothetical protein
MAGKRRGTAIALIALAAVLAAGRLAGITRSSTSAAPLATPTLPAPLQDCVAQPHRCGFPDASNSGIHDGRALARWAGGTISTPGMVLDSFEISGPVVIEAANVVIKHSRLHSGGPYDVLVRSGSLTIEDSDLSGSTEAVIGFDNWTGRRLNIHDFAGDGVKLGSHVTLEDSFIHAFATAQGAHADGAQMQSGEVAITLKHNTVLAAAVSGTPANSALFIAPDQGPSSPGPVSITDNLLAGGNYTIYIVDGGNGRYFEHNLSLTDNRFVRKSARFGPMDINVPVAQTGNVWDDTGLPVTS